MGQLGDLLASLAGRLSPSLPLHPSAEAYRGELEWFARLFADLSGPSPQYDRLRASYWDHIYGPVYDRFSHVDPRPAEATDRLVKFFRDWKGT